ncbi:MAG: hypothetical protein JW776_04065 [Candidatus Lokiarchaeota archaeon]|nr:hypothetical protein [Candidatus Lokiarchaeota archaeon]
MKKYTKYAIPFVMLFFLLPLNSAAMGTYTYGAPTKDWGIEIGDTHYYTLGWAVELEMGDKAWNMLDMILDEIDPTLDARTMYTHLMSVESVYNLRISITNITSYFYNSSPSYNSSGDLIMGEMAWKAASMTNYGPLNATMIYNLQQNAMLFNAYSTMLDWGISASELVEDLELYGPEMDEYYQSWLTGDSGEDFNQPDSPPFFIPKDWSLEDFYNEQRSKLNEYFYGNFSENTGVTVSNWEDFIEVLGIKSMRVNKRDATVKFQLTAMDMKLRDFWVNNTGFYDNGTKIETYNELLNFLNVTEFDAEARFDVEWNRKGILQNFHVQWEFSGKYEDEKFKFAPVFDLSYGEHDKINAKFTIPGYQIFVVVFAGIGTVSVIIIRIKKKNT